MELEGLYFLCSENESADDLRLCCDMCKTRQHIFSHGTVISRKPIFGVSDQARNMYRHRDKIGGYITEKIYNHVEERSCY